ncbi:MAG: DUF166 domain-containing protein [Promethearchaeota archaeon]
MVPEIKLYALLGGEYGNRIVENLVEHGFASWIFGIHEFTQQLPSFIEDPETYLPKDIPDCTVILSIGIHPDIASLLPSIARKSGAKAVIVPVSDPDWVPYGLQKQIEEELGEMEVNSTFPRPFCSLEEVGNPWIDTCAKHFGRPLLRVKLSEQKDRILSVNVLRGAPCGSTWYIAEKLEGASVDGAAEKAGIELHTYPCLASMKTDPLIKDTLLHVSGYNAKNALREAIMREQEK